VIAAIGAVIAIEQYIQINRLRGIYLESCGSPCAIDNSERDPLFVRVVQP